MLNEIKNKIVMSVQRLTEHDKDLKEEVEKVRVTFSDGSTTSCLAEDWDNTIVQVDSLLEKALILDARAFVPDLDS